MVNFDDFIKLGIEKSDENVMFTHLDIMRNYLTDEEMCKIIDHLIHKLGFSEIS